MEITIKRIYFNEQSTIGALQVNGEYLMDTLEPKAINWQVEKKVMGETAIPEGRYRLRMRHSAHYRCDMPFLEDVPYFTGIMIHTGNTVKDTRGCILVGKNLTPNLTTNLTPNLTPSPSPKERGVLSDSRKNFLSLYGRIERAIERGEEVWVTVRSYKGWGK